MLQAIMFRPERRKKVIGDHFGQIPPVRVTQSNLTLHVQYVPGELIMFHCAVLRSFQLAFCVYLHIQ